MPLTFFLLTYGLIAVESNVGLYLNRIGTALCGAVAMVLAGALSPAGAGGPVAQLFGMSGAMLVLANLVSNVPAVLLFRPLVPLFLHPHFVWLALASSATLAGNATSFRSVASLIVIQQLRSRGGIGFGQFTRVGLVVAVVTTVAAMTILAFEFLLAPHL
ncbi:MAG TPA: hypothetical protein VGS20_03140 [Candidatus Acidoferrales bacterium]|nr:hypothetical protein [Candidatus Acidoferrales bacterium]